MRRALWIVAIGFLLPMVGSCIFDAKKETKKEIVDNRIFRPLDKRDNIFFNLQLAYDQRNYGPYEELFDPEDGVFVFHFSPTDVSEGRVDVPNWGLRKELDSARKLLDVSPPAGQPFASTINLELTATEDEEDWIPFVDPSHPSEVWYRKTFTYDLSVTVGETTHAESGIIAQFDVRFTEVGGDSLWQVVTWRDDVGK
jgi:hypothetical protein